MNPKHRLWAFVLLALALAVSGGARAEDPGLAARLDALAGGFMATEQVPGAIAAVVAGDEVILRGWGYADLDARVPAGPDDVRFEIGSITKLFTWLAVMMLVEEGRLDLQADVTSYLRETSVPGAEPLTLAHLISHRPGFEDSYAIFDQPIAALPRPRAMEASAPAQVFPRGQVTSYSNWGVALAGQIVEEASGQSYEDFLKTRILAPLGMGDTTYSEATRRPEQPPLARSYRVQGGINHPAFRIDIGSFGPAGSVATTAADMARFLRFLLGDGALDGERLLRPETMAQMHTRLFDDRPEASDVTHGFQSRVLFGVNAFGHGGGLNEFLSNLVFVPELGAGVFISQNGGTGASLPFLGPDLILGALASKAAMGAVARVPVPDVAARAAEAEGRYLNNRRSFTGPTQFLGALSAFPVEARPDGALLAPAPRLQAMIRYEPIAPDVWEDALGDRLMLIRDADGAVIRLADGTGVHTYDRVRGFDDPIWLGAGFGLAALLSLTTLLGLLWRHGLRGGSRAGSLAAWAALAGAASVWIMTVAAIVAGLTAARLGSEYMFDQPQPTLTAFLTLADVVTVMGVIVLLSLVLAWRVPGWSLGRRLHQSVFALALVGLGLLMMRWGLAFGGPV